MGDRACEGGCCSRAPSVAAGVDRRRRASVWVLPERNVDPGRRSLVDEQEPERGSDSGRDERSFVALWDVSEDSDGDQAGGRRDGEGACAMTGLISEKEFSRRAFLKGGGALIVGFGLARAGLAGGASAAAPGTPLPVAVDQVDSYLTVHADNTVTLFSSIMERGQGTRTSLLMIAAEELDIGMDQISHAPLDTSTTPFTGLAGGSQGTTIGGSFVRAGAASAKQALLGLASANLGVPVARLSVDKGTVSGGGRSVTYGQLVGGKLFDVTVPQKVLRNELRVYQRLLRA